jgi:hypothetical protein
MTSALSLDEVVAGVVAALHPQAAARCDATALLNILEQHGIFSYEDLGDVLIGKAAEPLRLLCSPQRRWYFFRSFWNCTTSDTVVCLVTFRTRSRRRPTSNGGKRIATRSPCLQLHGDSSCSSSPACCARLPKYVIRSPNLRLSMQERLRSLLLLSWLRGSVLRDVWSVTSTATNGPTIRPDATRPARSDDAFCAACLVPILCDAGQG